MDEKLVRLYEDTTILDLSERELEGIKVMVVVLREDDGHPTIYFDQHCDNALPYDTFEDKVRLSNIQSIMLRSARLSPEEEELLGNHATIMRAHVELGAIKDAVDALGPGEDFQSGIMDRLKNVIEVFETFGEDNLDTIAIEGFREEVRVLLAATMVQARRLARESEAGESSDAYTKAMSRGTAWLVEQQAACRREREEVPVSPDRDWYDDIEPGIRHVVRALRDHGINTVSSCEGHQERYYASEWNKAPHVEFDIVMGDELGIVHGLLFLGKLSGHRHYQIETSFDVDGMNIFKTAHLSFMEPDRIIPLKERDGFYDEAWSLFNGVIGHEEQIPTDAVVMSMASLARIALSHMPGETRKAFMKDLRKMEYKKWGDGDEGI